LLELLGGSAVEVINQRQQFLARLRQVVVLRLQALDARGQLF